MAFETGSRSNSKAATFASRLMPTRLGKASLSLRNDDLPSPVKGFPFPLVVFCFSFCMCFVLTLGTHTQGELQGTGRMTACVSVLGVKLVILTQNGRAALLIAKSNKSKQKLQDKRDRALVNLKKSLKAKLKLNEDFYNKSNVLQLAAHESLLDSKLQGLTWVSNQFKDIISVDFGQLRNKIDQINIEQLGEKNDTIEAIKAKSRYSKEIKQLRNAIDQVSECRVSQYIQSLKKAISEKLRAYYKEQFQIFEDEIMKANKEQFEEQERQIKKTKFSNELVEGEVDFTSEEKTRKMKQVKLQEAIKMKTQVYMFLLNAFRFSSATTKSSLLDDFLKIVKKHIRPNQDQLQQAEQQKKADLLKQMKQQLDERLEKLNYKSIKKDFDERMEANKFNVDRFVEAIVNVTDEPKTLKQFGSNIRNAYIINGKVEDFAESIEIMKSKLAQLRKKVVFGNENNLQLQELEQKQRPLQKVPLSFLEWLISFLHRNAPDRVFLDLIKHSLADRIFQNPRFEHHLSLCIIFEYLGQQNDLNNDQLKQLINTFGQYNASFFMLIALRSHYDLANSVVGLQKMVQEEERVPRIQQQYQNDQQNQI